MAWSPEFLQEGFAVEDVLRPNRVIFGVTSDWATAMLYAAHKGVFDLAATEDREVPVVVTDFATAELVKVAANAFLATKISFINAMAEVCEPSGADVTMLARAIGYDARIGNKFLRAGVGFGGGCLPKDIRAFQARAQELGVGEALRFLHEVDLINQRRRQWVVQLAAELLGRPFGPAGPDLSGVTGRGARRDVQARTPTTSATRPPCPWSASSAAAAPTSPCTTPRAWRTPGARCPTSRTPRSVVEAVTGGRPGLRPHRVGGVPQRRPGRARRARGRTRRHRRPQLPGPGAVAPRRLGVPRHGPPRLANRPPGRPLRRSCSCCPLFGRIGDVLR